MLIDRKHAPLAIATACIAAAALAVYLVDAPRHIHGPSGGTALGITYGVMALALMLFCAALGIRRRVPHWRIGQARRWMRGHIWMGLLVGVFVALHSGFAAGGSLTTWLWVLTGIVIVSGIVGVAIQQVLPSLLLYGVPGETVWQQSRRELQSLPERTDAVVTRYAGSLETPAPAWPPEPAAEADAAGAQPAEVNAGAESAAGGKSGAAVKTKPAPAKKKAPEPNAPPFGAEPMRLFHRDYLRPYLAGDSGLLGNPTQSAALFRDLRTMCPPHIHPGIQELEELADRRRQLLRQRRLMAVMMAWLFFHVPVSWALILMAAIHAFMALRY